MRYKVQLGNQINKIDNFQLLLEKYKDYKSCIRDIKINTILGKKCLFEVENMSPPIYCDFKSNSEVSLQNLAIKIEKISFIIDSNLEIEDLEICYQVLETKMGKLVNELQSYGIELKINPKIMSYGWRNNTQVEGFYIETPQSSTFILS